MMIGSILPPAAFSVLAAALGATIIGAAPVLAQPQETEGITVFGRRPPPRDTETISRVVSYRDLDLTTSQGAATLEKRVRDTAQSICRTLHPSSSAAPIESRKAAGTCEQASLDDALPQVAAAVAAKRGSASR